MNTNELFIDGYKLPEPLSKEELYALIKAAKEGSKEDQDKLVVHNMRLVLYEVTSKFHSVNYDKKDLVSIGIIGLVKAINTFDLSKGYKFSTYAIRCIDNEILMFLRKLKKHQNVDSLDRVVFQDKDGSEIKLEDRLSDDTDLVEEQENAETYKIIREVVKELPDRDREIIMLHFGFYDNKIYTQKEIAGKFGISQSYASRLITKTVKKVGKILESQGVIELHPRQPKVKEKEKEIMSKLQTIYEYFKEYTREQIDEMLTKLTEDERALVTTRYGEDLDNPASAKLTREQTDRFYGTLVPRMKRLLANPTGERKQRKERVPQPSVIKQTPVIPNVPISQQVKPERTEEEVVAKPNASHEQPVTPYVPISQQVKSERAEEEVVVAKPNASHEQPVTPYVPISQQVKPERTKEEVVAKPNASHEQPVTPILAEKAEMVKEDYIKMLELLRTPTFTQMMSVLSVKEAIIISLKLGYVDGKYFSTESISQFLGIEETEVIETTKKVLLMYKESINDFLDNAIAVATNKTR